MDQTRDIMPAQWFGLRDFPKGYEDLEWLRDLHQDTYFALWLRNPSLQTPYFSLPLGHKQYVVAFLDEPFDHVWLLRQCKHIQEPIIVLNDGQTYDFVFPKNVYFFQYHSWHYQLNQIISWFPEKKNRVLRYKASTVCNRVTQYKLLIFTALMRYVGIDQCLVKLSDWVEEKNVHFRQRAGDELLDGLMEEFFNDWYSKKISVDDFSNQQDNYQRINSNPWTQFYTDAAIHFTNESYHYSLMDDEYGPSIRPGPCLSEKTYKCLVAGTPFISVAQFDVYQSFSRLGFKFDYGPIDLSWDSDPGNISRMVKIINLIRQLADMSIGDIIAATQDSTEHNTEHVWSGKFAEICQQQNNMTAHKILSEFS